MGHAEAVFSHQAGHPMYAVRLTRVPKIEKDPQRPVNGLARGKRCPDQAE